MTNDPTQPSGNDSTASLDGLGDDQDIILEETDEVDSAAGDSTRDSSTSGRRASAAGSRSTRRKGAAASRRDADDEAADHDSADDDASVEDGADDDATDRDDVDDVRSDDDAADDAADADNDAATDADDDDEVPYELREDTPEPGTEPATGLVSDIRDLTFGQAAGLVSNREMSSIGRSPLFVVPTLLIVVGIIAGIIFGATQGEEAGGTPVVAAVGIGDPTQIEQAYSISVVEAADAAAAEQLVRDGEAEAAILPDTTGQSQLGVQIIALSDEPTTLLERLQPPPEVLYLQQRPVSETVAAGVNWGMAIILILSVLGLGYGLFSNLLLERRNRIGELLASTIPAKASAWGRIAGATTLALVQAALGVGVLMLGLSVTGQQEVLVALLPALGYFFGLTVFVFAVFMGLYLAVSSSPRPRGRTIGYGVISGLAVLSGLVPLFLAGMPNVLLWLSYIPLTSPVAMPVRLLQQELPIWQPLLALGIALVAALIVYAIAAGGYASNLLRGTGRGGRTATDKAEKKRLKDSKKEAAAVADSEDEDEGEGDDEPSTKRSTRVEAARPKKGAKAAGKGKGKDTVGAKDSGDSKDSGDVKVADDAELSDDAEDSEDEAADVVGRDDAEESTGVDPAADSPDADKAEEKPARATPSSARTSSQQRKTPPASKSRRRRKR